MGSGGKKKRSKLIEMVVALKNENVLLRQQIETFNGQIREYLESWNDRYAYALKLERMHTWFPIEDAPKDNTVVDLWDGSFRIIDCRWSLLDKCWVSAWDHKIKITGSFTHYKYADIGVPQQREYKWKTCGFTVKTIDGDKYDGIRYDI